MSRAKYRDAESWNRRGDRRRWYSDADPKYRRSSNDEYTHVERKFERSRLAEVNFCRMRTSLLRRYSSSVIAAETRGKMRNQGGILNVLKRDIASRRIAPRRLPLSVSLSRSLSLALESANREQDYARSIIRDCVEHAIPRESFKYAPLGMRPSQRSQTSRARRSTSVARTTDRNCPLS